MSVCIQKYLPKARNRIPITSIGSITYLLKKFGITQLKYINKL